MSGIAVSIVISDKYNKLIVKEVENKNFASKSEFFRHVMRNWFEKSGTMHKK